METSFDICKKLLMRLEGLGDGDVKEPGLQPYLCPAGVWTIGYGRALYSSELKRFLTKVYPSDKEVAYRMYPSVTIEEAEQMLDEDIQVRNDKVLSFIKNDVTVSQHELAAYISFAYNIGLGAFEDSTCLKYINKGNARLARAAMGFFVKASGCNNVGLADRRYTEQKCHEGIL